MKFYHIQTTHFKIYVYDTSRIKTEVNNYFVWKKVRPYLLKISKVFEDFLRGKYSDEINLSLDNVREFELHLTLCGRHKIKTLNRTYRNKNRATDVLAFPVFDSLRGKTDLNEPIISLGDVFVCKDLALRQAKQHNITARGELIHLLIHGFLHLCGHDHDLSDKEAKIMFNLEDVLMTSFQRRR